MTKSLVEEEGEQIWEELEKMAEYHQTHCIKPTKTNKNVKRDF